MSTAGPFKTVRNQDGGAAKEVGGDDWDRFADLLNGVSNVANVRVNSDWEFKYRRLWLRNQADNLSVNLAAGPITANVLVRTPALSADDELVTANASQRLTGKTLDGAENTITNIEGGGVSGRIQAPRAATGGSAAEGILQGFVDNNPLGPPITAVGPPPYGHHWIYSTGTTINTNTGIRYPAATAFIRTDLNPTIRFKFRTPLTGGGHQLLVGLSTDGTITQDQDPVLSSQSAVLVGYRHSPDTSFMIFRNGGTSTSGSAPTIESANNAGRGTALREIVIDFTSGGAVCTITSRSVIGNTIHFGPIVLNTNLPNPGEAMYPVFQLTSRNTSNHDLHLHRIDLKQDY